MAFFGLNPVTVECKFTEAETSPCSRPDLRLDRPEHCDGSYTRQRGRRNRCSLTEIGVRYWEFVPLLFHINADIDHRECPLNATYQLVRNLLATCVSPEGLVLPEARVVLLHDERNPSFQREGIGWAAYHRVKSMLRDPRMLQRATWQNLVRLLQKDPRTEWLAEALDAKYGFLEGQAVR